MTILVVVSHDGELSSIKVDDKLKEASSVRTIRQITNPLPTSGARREEAATEWVLRHPAQANILFVLTSFGTKAKSVLTTFRIDATGSPAQLSSCSTGGYLACHATVNPSGTCLAIAHLHCGRVSLFNIQGSATYAATGPPMLNIVRLPVLYPYNLIPPEASTTGLGVPAANGVSFSPNGEYFCVAEPSQHAVITYRCEASSGRLETLGAYKPQHGLPMYTNSAFSYVQSETRFDPETFCQDLAILLGGEWGPRVSKVVVNSNGRFIYALQENSKTIGVFEVVNSGMVVPQLLQEIRVAGCGTAMTKLPCTNMSAITVSDMIAGKHGLILSISSEGSVMENGIRIIEYEGDGSSLRLGQHIQTQAPVQHVSVADDGDILWVGISSCLESYVQKYQKLGDGEYGNYALVGEACVGSAGMQCFVALDETNFPDRKAERRRASKLVLPAGISTATISEPLVRSSSGLSSASMCSSDADKAPRSGTAKEEARRARLKPAFDKQDVNKSGYLELWEVAKIVAEESGQPCQLDDVLAFMKLIDKDGDGRIDFEEFYLFARGKSAPSPSTADGTCTTAGGADQNTVLKAAFAAQDADGSGFLEAPEVAKVLAELGHPTSSNKDAEELIKMIDQDGDGKINFEEFCTLVRQRFGKMDASKATKDVTAATDPTTKKKKAGRKDVRSLGGEETTQRRMLREAFEKRDVEGSGYLEEWEVAKALWSLGQPASTDAVAEFIKSVDADGDGKINFEEFCVFASHTMAKNKQQKSNKRRLLRKIQSTRSGLTQQATDKAGGPPSKSSRRSHLVKTRSLRSCASTLSCASSTSETGSNAKLFICPAENSDCPASENKSKFYAASCSQTNQQSPSQ